jgi:hypothetical protein
VLVAMAFVLRFWLRTSLALDVAIHDTYRVVPLISMFRSVVVETIRRCKNIP